MDNKLVKLFAYEIVNELHREGPKKVKDFWWDSSIIKRQFTLSAIDYLYDENSIFLNNKNKIELTEKLNKSRGWV